MDEVRLFRALARHCNISGIQLQPYGGRDNLKSYLNTFMSLGGFGSVETLAIVGDANSSLENATKRIQDVLREADLPVPDNSLHMKVSVDRKPRTCFLIIPHDSATGMLEDVCLKSVKGDPALECIEEYFACIDKSKIPGPKNRAKARVHAFLASRPDPGLRLGEAADAKIWKFEADAFRPLKQLLNLLNP